MRPVKNSLLCLLLVLEYTQARAQSDSLFVDSVKRFAAAAFNTTWTRPYYTQWSAEAKKPYIYLYVSKPQEVGTPPNFSGSFIFMGVDEKQARFTAGKYEAAGHHTFAYHTFANSSAVLNNTLLSYPPEEIAFIVFHELMHNYLAQEAIKIPYEFNEALCDVIGNHLTNQYAGLDGRVDSAQSAVQTSRNEAIYRVINSYTKEINARPGEVPSLNKSCDSAIHALLPGADAFQKTRFDYPVNNAYLLKNRFYSKNYFLLKKVLMKQASVGQFLFLMKYVPEDAEACRKYLRELLKQG